MARKPAAEKGLVTAVAALLSSWATSHLQDGVWNHRRCFVAPLLATGPRQKRARRSHPIVSHRVITRPPAARSVISTLIKGLHAKRARDLLGNNRNTEPVRGCDAKDLRFHDGVDTVICGGDCCHPRTCMSLHDAIQTFLLTSAGGLFHQTGVDFLSIW